MAKKQLVPDTIQKLFNKLQFKLNQPVSFTWLGIKKYGYVIRTKQTSWGIMYTIASNGTKYPCGIQIKTHKTQYTTGCILVDDTRSIGEIELERRIQTGDYRTTTEVFSNADRQTDACGSINIDSGRISKTTSRKIAKSDVDIKSNDVSSNDARVCNDTAKKRTNSKLNTAIQKQRDFLNGFIIN